MHRFRVVQGLRAYPAKSRMEAMSSPLRTNTQNQYEPSQTALCGRDGLYLDLALGKHEPLNSEQ